MSARFAFGTSISEKMDALSYFNDEQKEKMRELLSGMFSVKEGEDLLWEEDSTQEELLFYYSEVERWALECANQEFGMEFTYHSKPKSAMLSLYRSLSQHFYCYLDGFVQTDSKAVVIEVKATTSKKLRI